MSLLSNYRLSGNTHDTLEFGEISIGSGSFIYDEKGLVANIRNTYAVVPLNRIPLTLSNETISFWMKCEFPRASALGGAFENRIIQWGNYHSSNSGGVGLQSGQVRCFLRGPNANGWTDYPIIWSMDGVYDTGGWIHYAISFTPDNRFKVYANGVKHLDIALSTPYTGLTSAGVSFGIHMLSRLSDVRVYTETLSDDAIYDLYAQRGSLGKDGVLYAPHLTESPANPHGPTPYAFSVKALSEIGPNVNLLHWYPLITDNHDRLRLSTDTSTNITYDDNGAVFTGTGQIQSGKIILPTDAFTLSAWVVSVDTGSFSTLVGQGDAVDTYSGFALAADWRSGDRRTALLWRVPDGGFTTDFPGFFEHKSGVAIHVVLTYHAGTLTAYRDGVVFGSKTHNPPGSGGAHLILGSRVTEDYRLTGNLRDLKVYTDVLTSTEIQVLYDLTRPNGQAMITTPTCTHVKGHLTEVR